MGENEMNNSSEIATSGAAMVEAQQLHKETGNTYIVAERKGKHNIYIDSKFSRELIKKNVEQIIYITPSQQGDSNG
jgi:hypothetical protein